MIRAALIIFALLASPAVAETAVYDGDTTQGTGRTTITIVDPRYRLRGVDTPEIGWRAECPEELALGLEAKAALEAYIEQGAVAVHHESFGLGQYGRIPVVYLLGHLSVNAELVRRGLAMPTEGARFDWCPFLQGRDRGVPLPLEAPR